MSRVAIIGPGRVGGAMALGLLRAGHDVGVVAGRNPASASLARFARLVPAARTVDVSHAPVGVDLVVVTTVDDQIAHVVRSAAQADTIAPGQRWVHTSGGYGLDVLGVARAAGARVAACHPAMTFPDPSSGAEHLVGTSWAVTADHDDRFWAEQLIRDLAGEPVPVAERNRALYHAALTVGSNGTAAVVTLARDLLLGAGVDNPTAFLRPLIEASALGAAEEGVQALTGPVRRGDAGTLDRHLTELQDTFPEAVATYLALCDLLVSQAARAGLDAAGQTKVRTVLDELRG